MKYIPLYYTALLLVSVTSLWVYILYKFNNKRNKID
jgi:hypothetical protein